IADLGAELGVLLSFSGAPEPAAAGVEQNFSLNDTPPEALPPDEETPLAELPALAIEVETTGLSVRDDRIVAIGAVRTFGDRIYPAASLEELVNPGIMIPPRATASHGISDDMVEGARTFMQVFETMQPLAHATVLVGHGIAFEMAMLKREAGLAGLRWDPPPALCTMMLVAALEPDRKEFGLETVAQDFGVEPGGRGVKSKAVLAAELFSRLIPLLAKQDVGTLGDALEFAGRPKHLIEKQKAAGWG
ncbi:MAG: 3'-5' exonuclease, partial [Acetobacterales bacterium]